MVVTALMQYRYFILRFFLQVSQAYRKIFDELGVPWIRVAGDTGVIGGSESHEFHYPAGIGQTRENERGERSRGAWLCTLFKLVRVEYEDGEGGYHSPVLCSKQWRAQLLVQASWARFTLCIS